jgi:hypothetical protein
MESSGEQEQGGVARRRVGEIIREQMGGTGFVSVGWLWLVPLDKGGDLSDESATSLPCFSPARLRERVGADDGMSTSTCGGDTDGINKSINKRIFLP